MLKGINNSVLYIDYWQKVMFYTLMERGGHAYAKENKDLYRFGLQGWPLQ